MGRASRYLELARQYEAEIAFAGSVNPSNTARARELAREFKHLAGKYVSLESLGGRVRG